MNSPKVDVFIVGAGMYVCGRGTSGYGTVLPALFEGRRRGLIGSITVSALRQISLDEIRTRAAALGKFMGVDGSIDCVPAPAVPHVGGALAKRSVAAIIAVPDEAHADAAVPLLERGIPCLVVKPFAPTRMQAHRMVEAAKRGGAYGAVEFHKRWDAANERLRDEIRADRLGIPLYAVVQFSQKKIVPTVHFREWAHRTNVFQYLGVHYVDLILYATGYQPEVVSACGQRVYLKEQGIDTEDAMQVTIRWRTPHGAPFVSTILTNWIDPNGSSAMSDQRITVVGTAGRYESDQKDRGIHMVTDDRGPEDINPYFTSLSYDPGIGGLRCWGYGPESILTFIADVADLKQGTRSVADLEGIRPTFESALISTAVIEAATKSLKRDGVWEQVAV